MWSVWTKSRSFFSCALMCAIWRSPTLTPTRALAPWQYNIHGGAAVGGGTTDGTIPYEPYGPTSTSASASTISTSTTTGTSSTTSSTSSTTSSTSTVTIPLCSAIGAPFEADIFTSLAVPASENTTVPLEFQSPLIAGCCVGSILRLSVTLNSISEASGIVAIFLESPNGQSELLGSEDAQDPGFIFSSDSGIVFPGEVLAGVWKVILLGSVDAAGYLLTFSRLTVTGAQCVWLIWRQERWWKDGCFTCKRLLVKDTLSRSFGWSEKYIYQYRPQIAWKEVIIDFPQFVSTNSKYTYSYKIL